MMNLGVERNRIGDIMLGKDAAYLICEYWYLRSFSMENLTKVRHTLIHLEECALDEDQ